MMQMGQLFKNSPVYPLTNITIFLNRLFRILKVNKRSFIGDDRDQVHISSTLVLIISPYKIFSNYQAPSGIFLISV